MRKEIYNAIIKETEKQNKKNCFVNLSIKETKKYIKLIKNRNNVLIRITK